MRRRRGFFAALAAALLATLLWALPALAQNRSDAPPRFDYYVLSLSWSPQYCATDGSRSPRQCATGRRYGFVAHGLWPQYERGGYPEFCRTGGGGPTRDTVERIIDIMPSEGLIRHQWNKHGACSGLTASRYFDLTAEAFAAVTLPEFYLRPTGTLSRSVAQVKTEFAAANPRLPPTAIAVTCSGQYLQEVRICLEKSLQPRACGPDAARSNCRGNFIVRPIR
ncbi:MAG: ribonuclease T [Reyranellaceae bacterium]